MSDSKNPASDSKKSDKEKSEKEEKDKSKEKDKKPEVKKELTEEDLKLKADLDLLVSIVKDAKKPNQSELEFQTLQKNALEQLRKEIRTSTGSMTALPKPLKFLRTHYADLKTFYTTMDRSANKVLLGEILSVLGMSVPAASEGRESLTLKLQTRALVEELKLPKDTIGEWGHEYVRHLSGEIGKEYSSRFEATPAVGADDLIQMADEIVPFFLAHNAEYDAVDLLLETEGIQKITAQISSDNCDRIGKYLLKCVDYIVDPEEQTKIFIVAYEAYLKFKFYADALRVAMRLGDKEKLVSCFRSCDDDKLMQKQLAFLLGSQKIVLDELKDDEEIFKCMGNSQMSSYFQHLAADLDVKEAKSVEDITKPHLEGAEGGRRTIRAQATKESGVDNAKQNLAGTFINSFVNCGFGKDLLVTPEGSEWLYKNKTHGMLSAAASLGMIMLWDVDSGFSAVDRFSFSRESYIKAGSALAHGILSSGVTSEMDAAQALLSEHLESKDIDLKISAILGLGLAYAGTQREDVLEQLVPILVQAGQSIEVVSTVCLSLGLVFCGTANEDISGNIVEAFLDRSDTDLKDSTARMMCLGMGLLFLGKGDNVEGALQALKVIEHPINKYLATVVETCAYAGSGSVLQIQKLLNLCAEHFPEDEEATDEKKNEEKKNTEEKKSEEKKDAAKDKEKEKKEKDPLRGMHQEAAVLGIAAVALGEELSQEMALRALDHVLQYAEVNIRRVVPFAVALLSLSWPRVTVVDTLTKLSHDQDQMVSQNAVLALGFVGAGTNNSRIATQLRNLASYYKNEPNHLFLIRIAQGLLHMGKGLLTLNPISHDGFLLNKVSLSGILIVLHASMDLKNSILSKRHYLLYSLVTAIRPRMLMILDENLKPIAVPVRVGQKVDIVGMAGKPKSITGFQTHTTPVLISVGERAELANDEYIPLSSVLEGFVIAKKNPNYVDDKEKSKSSSTKDSKK